jgi:hypothetical protein
MAKKYSSVRPKITSPLVELQCSLESAYLRGIPKIQNYSKRGHHDPSHCYTTEQ